MMAQKDHYKFVEQSMWNSILRKIRILRIVSLFILIEQFLSVEFALLGIMTTGFAIFKYDKKLLPLYLFFGVGAIVFISIYIAVYIVYKKNGADRNGVDPYIVRINPLSFDDLIKRISSHMCLHEINDGWYTYDASWAGVNNILCTYSNTNEYEKESFGLLRNRVKNQARKACKLKAGMSIAKANGLIEIDIYTFNSTNPELIDKTRENAVFGTKYAVAKINIYIDLHSGMIYIPKYISTWYGGLKAYSEAIRYIRDVFKVLETACGWQHKEGKI